MVKQTTVVLVDDIDGGAADETVTFALDGVAYELDLTSENAETMRQVLQSYASVARRSNPPQMRNSRHKRAIGSDDTEAIRAWARENGRSVSDRGRIAATVREAYERSRSR
jgi:hypothetical protein